MVLLCTLCPVSFWTYHYFIENRDLKAALAEADRVDPGWRIEELEAARSTIPDKENGARVLLEASSSLKATWPTPPVPLTAPSLEEQLLALAPNEQLGEPLLQQLKAELAPADGALPVARRLADFPTGRYSIHWNPDVIGTPLSHLQEARRIALLLNFDAILRAQQGDTDGALVSCHAASNAGRTIGDEPFAVSQLVRAHCQEIAVRGTARALAQGTPNSAALERLQHSLEMEAAEPALLRVVRSARAVMYHALQFIKTRGLDRRAYAMRNPWNAPDSVVNVVDAIIARACQAAYLQFFTEYVEIAKLPPEEVRPRLEHLGKPQSELPPLLAGMSKEDVSWGMARRILTVQALLRCAITALALERYRQQEQHWPASLAELVPVYLKEVPSDPFDGASLRFRKMEDGVVVYALDPGGKHYVGDLLRTGSTQGNVGFRLWDVLHRRQPAITPSPKRSPNSKHSP